MITKSELSKYAQRLKYTLAQAELDYFQHVILSSLYSKFSTLYFKGGTCLQKCYGIKRFSEDLDFNSVDVSLEQIMVIITSLFDDVQVVEKYEGSFGKSCKIKFKGILFDGTDRSMVRLSIDVRNGDVFEPGLQMVITPIYDDLSRYFVIGLNVKEIFAEKVRAICTRSAARDLFDMAELVRQDVEFDSHLIAKKLEGYGLTFSVDFFVKRVDLLAKTYDSEMKRLVALYPSFSDARALVVAYVEG